MIMLNQDERQMPSTSYFDSRNMRKRPLQQGIIDEKICCTEANMTQRRIPYDWTMRSFITLVILHALSLSCTAFHTSIIVTKRNKIPFQHREKHERLAICRVQHVPFVMKSMMRLSMPQSADDVVDMNNTNATTVSANQSTLPLTDDSSHSNSKPVQPPQLSSFGDVVSIKQRPVMNESNREHAVDTPSFGDVVSLRKNTQTTELHIAVTPVSNVAGGTTISEERQMANQIRFRNTVVAVLSIAVAIGNFVYQYLHPIEPIQILFDLQQSSADISVVGKNHKPTVIDFWAPWCENCKFSAATLQSIERQYGNDVNFILINGDLASSWPYIEALGVDAIPHMSMISYDGVVETALIGPIPKHIIQEDIEVLLLNSRNNAEAIRTIRADMTSNDSSDNQDTSKELNEQQPEHIELPHKMLDVFAGKPESARRIQFE